MRSVYVNDIAGPRWLHGKAAERHIAFLKSVGELDGAIIVGRGRGKKGRKPNPNKRTTAGRAG